MTDEDPSIRHERLRRCSEIFKYNSPWARESRQAYLRHGNSDYKIDDTVHVPPRLGNNGDIQQPDTPPFVDILRDSDTRHDSPRANRSDLFKAPPVCKVRNAPNGVLFEERRLRNADRAGSGQDIVERAALMLDTDDMDCDLYKADTRRRSSLGNTDFVSVTITMGHPRSQAATGNNNNTSQKGPIADSLAMEEMWRASDQVTSSLT